MFLLCINITLVIFFTEYKVRCKCVKIDGNHTKHYFFNEKKRYGNMISN